MGPLYIFMGYINRCDSRISIWTISVGWKHEFTSPATLGWKRSLLSPGADSQLASQHESQGSGHNTCQGTCCWVKKLAYLNRGTQAPPSKKKKLLKINTEINSWRRSSNSESWSAKTSDKSFFFLAKSFLLQHHSLLLPLSLRKKLTKCSLVSLPFEILPTITDRSLTNKPIFPKEEGWVEDYGTKPDTGEKALIPSKATDLICKTQPVFNLLFVHKTQTR